MSSSLPVAPSSAATVVVSPDLTHPWRCPNEVLHRLFPSSSLSTLRYFLIHHAKYSESAIQQPNDSSEYRQLLSDTIVVNLQEVANLYADAADHQAKLSFAQAGTLPFDHISLNHWTAGNPCPKYTDTDARDTRFVNPLLVAMGYNSSSQPQSKQEGMHSILHRVIARLLKKGPHISILTQGYAKLDNHRNRSGIGDMYIHNVETNTIVTHLQTQPWNILLTRIGEETISWLLFNTAMFTAVNNNCMVQLTGPALVKLNKIVNLAKSYLSRKPSRTVNGPNSRKERKAKNPSKNLKGLDPEQKEPIPPAMPIPISNVSNLFPSPPVLTASSSRVARKRRRSLLRPTKFVPLVTPLPRSTMFYRAPIKNECGLPSSHPFHLCRASKRGALRLISQIFQLCDSSHTTPTATAHTAPSNTVGIPVASPSRTQSLAAQQVQLTSPLKSTNQTLLRSHSTPMAANDAATPAISTRSAHTPQLPVASSTSISNRSTRPVHGIPTPVCALDFLSAPATIIPRQRLVPPQVGLEPSSLDSAVSNDDTSKTKKKRVRVKTDARKAKRLAQLQQRTQKNDDGNSLADPSIPNTNRNVAQAATDTPQAKAPLKTEEALSSNSNPSPLPLLPGSPPPRLRPLLPILQSLLKRHHNTYYGRWLQQCCPWQLPKGFKLPKHVQPTKLQNASIANEQPVVTSSEAVPMSIDDQSVPEAMASASAHTPIAAASSPPLSATSASNTFPSLSSCLSSSTHSKEKSVAPMDDDLKQKHYWTQAMEEDSEEEDTNKDATSRPAVTSAQSISIAAASFTTVSEKFNPPEIHVPHPAAMSVVQPRAGSFMQSRRSTPSVSTDATAMELLQGLQSTPASASHHTASSSGDNGTLTSVSTSQLSKSQRKRARLYRQKQLVKRTSAAAAGSPLLQTTVLRRLSSKQTQTPSRRAQAIIVRLSASNNSASHIPLSELRLEVLIKMHTSSAAVISFLRCVCMSVLPLSLFGSQRNRQRFLQNASLFVRLRRFETMTGIQLMTGMKIKDVPWLQMMKSSPRQPSSSQARVEPANEPLPLSSVSIEASNGRQADRRTVPQKRKYEATISDSLQSPEQSFQQNKRQRSSCRSRKAIHYPPSHHITQVRLFSTLLRFLMTDFVLPLLRNNFYATDSESSKHRIVYYRREIWNEIVRKSMYELSGGGKPTEGMPFPNASEASVEDHTSGRSMFVRMDKLAALNYLHERLKDIPSSSNQPPAPASTTNAAIANSTSATNAAVHPAPSIVAATGAPIAASSSASTLAGHGLGIAKLRLRPRKNGSIRPIVNMARGGTIRVAQQFQTDGTLPSTLHYSPINTVLRHVFEVIRYEKEESSPTTSQAKVAPSIPTATSASSTASATSTITKNRKPSNVLGCSVFGVNAIYNRFQTFSHQWRGLRPIDEIAPPLRTVDAGVNQQDARSAKRQKRRCNSSSVEQTFAPLYAVSVDVKHCFDTINRVKLLSIMSSLLSEPSYSLSRYTSLMPLFGVIRPKFLRSVSPACSIPMFLTECIRRSTAQRHVVYTDAVNRRFLDAETILATLHEHIYQNIVKLGSVMYHQTDGIPQGSVLSSVLCCLYLAHVEKRSILPYLIKSANDAFHKQRASVLKFKRTQSTPAVSTINPTSDSIAAHSVVKSSSTANDSHKRVRPAEIAPAATNIEMAQTSTSTTPAPIQMHPSVYAPIHLLLRQMDDFLYITTSKEAAMTFHKIMQRGFKQEYGLEINDSKTRVWFGEEEHARMAASSSATPLPVVSRTMAWNGFNIDVPTLAISADYTRMHCDATESATNKRSKKVPQGVDVIAEEEKTKESDSLELLPPSLHVDPSSLVDSLTIDGCRHSGLNLSKSFRRFLHPKMHPLLLDGNLHSFAVVSQNVFDNFVVSCAKLVVCEKQLQKNSMGTDNQWFTLKTILDGIEYALHLTHARFRVRNQDEHANSSNSPNAAAASSSFPSSATPALKSRFPLSNVQFRYLALSACVLVFRRKQTRFRFALSILQQLISKFNRSWLVRLEQCTPAGFPNHEAASKITKNRAASSAEDGTESFLHCIQESMYQQFRDYQTRCVRPVGGLVYSAPGRASVAFGVTGQQLLRIHGNIPRPRKKMKTNATPSPPVVGRKSNKNEKKPRIPTRALAETSTSSHKRRKLSEVKFVIGNPAVDSAHPDSAATMKPQLQRKLVQCICGSKTHQLPAASFLDRLQLDDLDHMLPKLSHDATKLLQAIRF